jgi:hypothetical protein
MASTSPRQRSRLTNRPLAVRASPRTSQGRRIRDLFGAIMSRLNKPDDALVQAAALRVAELQVIGEQVRAEMLAGKTYDAVLGGELVRIENMVRRAKLEVDELIAEANRPLSYLEQQLRIREAE